MRIAVALLAALMLLAACQIEVATSNPVAECAGETFAGAMDRSPVGEDTEAFESPTVAERTTFEAAFAAWFDQRPGDAVDKLAEVDYELCRLPSPEDNWVLWRPSPASSGQAFWALNSDSQAEPLIIEVPHPGHDLDTRAQGIGLAEHLSARALIVSGTHRCANAAPSNCSGQTTACGTLEAYRESDLAHTLESRFHVAHVAVSEQFANDRVVSLHGFGDDGASLSNGTTEVITTDDPVAMLAAALADSLPTGDPQTSHITTCNDYDGATVEARLCGTTNVQGRHLNDSADACTQSANQASERFIHLEQSLSIRQDHSDSVAEAFRVWLDAD